MCATRPSEHPPGSRAAPPPLSLPPLSALPGSGDGPLVGQGALVELELAVVLAGRGLVEPGPVEAVGDGLAGRLALLPGVLHVVPAGDQDVAAPVGRVHVQRAVAGALGCGGVCGGGGVV